MKIFAVPFSGGGKYCYREFAFTTLELPGHGGRMGETLLKNAMEMAKDLVNQLPFSNSKFSPYALFGHSLGGLLVYLMARLILKEYGPRFLPAHLFISGRAAPSRPLRRPYKHQLPLKDFYDYLASLGGPSGLILKNPELVEIFTPILRADIEAGETYIHQASQPLLPMPITLFYGLEESLDQEDLEAWREETSGEVRLVPFPGNHFFLFSFVEEISQVVTSALEGRNKYDPSSVCANHPRP